MTVFTEWGATPHPASYGRWLRLTFAVIGAVQPAFWATLSWAQLVLSDPPVHALPLCLTGFVVVAAFAVTWWLPRTSVVAIWISLALHSAAVADAATTGGQPLIGALFMIGPPLLGAVPMTLLAWTLARIGR